MSIGLPSWTTIFFLVGYAPHDITSSCRARHDPSRTGTVAWPVILIIIRSLNRTAYRFLIRNRDFIQSNTRLSVVQSIAYLYVA